MERVYTGGGNEATNFFHSSLTYSCFGTTILNFLTHALPKIDKCSEIIKSKMMVQEILK